MTYYTQHEARKYRSESYQSMNAAARYKSNWLELRKQLREYSKETGHAFPKEIRKAIGMK